MYTAQWSLCGTSYQNIALCLLTGGGQGEVSCLDLRSYHRSHGSLTAHEFREMEPKDSGIFPKKPAQAVI